MSGFGGRYRIQEKLGFGGMAEVFLAVAAGAAGFERTVVVKRLLPALAEDPGFARSFLEEARLLAKLQHPHIAQVIDLGEADDGTYLVMEHVDGGDLREVMERLRAPVDPGLAASIVRDVCEALDYGFTRVEAGVPLKLIHRDVSLSNIMISRAGVVKLVDFGLAKALTGIDRQNTASGVVKGKWSYLAPEVLAGHAADHRSDLYSAGVVLFELACGRKLFKPTQLLREMVLERELPRPPLGQLVPAAADLEPIVTRALSADPAARYQRAEEMAEALDRVVHGRRVRPPQLAELMANLFDPKRLRATQNMRADALSAEYARVVAGQPQTPADAVAAVDPTPEDGIPTLADEEPATQVAPPMEIPDTDPHAPVAHTPLESPALPPSIAPVPAIASPPTRPVPSPPPFSEPMTVVSTRRSPRVALGVPRWMIFSTAGVVAVLVVVTLVVLLVK
jgi:serine/threonine-protein kinase